MAEQFVTVRAWAEHLEHVRARLMNGQQRTWPEGSVHACLDCGGRLTGRSDLVREIDAVGAVLIFSNLHGAVCDDCHLECLEPYDQVAIQERAETTLRAPIEGSVTILGGKKLGTYWPQDVAQALGLHAKDKLRITPLAADTAVVRVVHDHDEPA